MKKKMIAGVLVSIIAIISFALIITFKTAEVKADDIYSELPPKPSNIDIVNRELSFGTISDICNLDSSYYLRPEFYPDWEKEKGNYENHDYSVWKPYGYGMYYSQQGAMVRNFKAGEEMTFCGFFRTDFEIETYQGIQLSGEHNEYFEVIPDPSLFTTQPTYPKFGNKWARQITIKVKAKQNIPIGNYSLKVNVQATPKWYNEQEIWKLIKSENATAYVELCSKSLENDKCKELYNQRKSRYVVGSTWGITDGIFKINMVVVE